MKKPDPILSLDDVLEMQSHLLICLKKKHLYYYLIKIF